MVLTPSLSICLLPSTLGQSLFNACWSFSRALTDRFRPWTPFQTTLGLVSKMKEAATLCGPPGLFGCFAGFCALLSPSYGSQEHQCCIMWGCAWQRLRLGDLWIICRRPDSIRSNTAVPAWERENSDPDDRWTLIRPREGAEPQMTEHGGIICKKGHRPSSPPSSPSSKWQA